MKSPRSIEHHAAQPKAFAENHRPRAFPTRREGTVYVGWGPAKGPPGATGLKECPPSCRPEGHQDWTFC